MGDKPTDEQKARQRELQRKALEMRKRGLEYERKNTNTRLPKAERKLLDKRPPRSPRKGAKPSPTAKSERAAAKKKAQPEVVIVPIFWKGKAGEMASVVSLCADAERLLNEGGKRAVTDGGHKFTPGQKFAHWEHRGVMLRVEVGPEEASQGCCTLARCFEAGVPAKRIQGVAVEAQGLLARLEELTHMEEGDAAAAEAAYKTSAQARTTARAQKLRDDASGKRRRDEAPTSAVAKVKSVRF